MEQSVSSDRVTDYLADLRPHLDDLDETERAEVLEELADALLEVEAENEGPLREVLGPPADYVAAYRASAGLERQGAPRRGRLRAAAGRVRADLRSRPWWPRAVALAVLLRPAWWTLRGAAPAVWVCSILDISFFGPIGLLLITAGVAASLAVGGERQPTRDRRVLLRVANGLAIVAALWLFSFAGSVRENALWAGYAKGQNEGQAFQDRLRMPNGDPVTNIHAYTRDGEPLTDVLLYDAGGRPLQVLPRRRNFLSEDRTRYKIEYQRDADGQPITNLYPLEQYEVEWDNDGNRVTDRLRRSAPAIVLPRALETDPTAAPDADPTTAPGAADSPAAATSEPGPRR